MLLRQMCFLCGFIAFRVAGIKHPDKSNSGKEEYDSQLHRGGVSIAAGAKLEATGLLTITLGKWQNERWRPALSSFLLLRQSWMLAQVVVPPRVERTSHLN